MYGIAHDLVTAHVCLEYFTVAHPPILPDAGSVGQAMSWGVVATWWVGVGLSVPLALACRAGTIRRWGARELARPIGFFLATLWLVSMGGGVIGYTLSQAEMIRLFPPYYSLIDATRHARFWFCVFAHQAAYGVGALGGLGLTGYIIFRRWCPVGIK